ncbi:hypothetical protein GALMADRAFT_143967 [Galerina marginata CBS 339.88]|uniref:Uncharacterized protein n=1 Tax=Galerina marginata (strain CBS 339.88) TaxID=685588 RepID=A0A067SK42_GALM3|nr:hypothetical protein GALMADRAFT_143967 [Galerina marginata CBS 339.88]
MDQAKREEGEDEDEDEDEQLNRRTGWLAGRHLLPSSDEFTAFAFCVPFPSQRFRSPSSLALSGRFCSQPFTTLSPWFTRPEEHALDYPNGYWWDDARAVVVCSSSSPTTTSPRPFGPKVLLWLGDEDGGREWLQAQVDMGPYIVASRGGLLHAMEQLVALCIRLSLSTTANWQDLVSILSSTFSLLFSINVTSAHPQYWGSISCLSFTCSSSTSNCTLNSPPAHPSKHSAVDELSRRHGDAAPVHLNFDFNEDLPNT